MQQSMDTPSQGTLSSETETSLIVESPQEEEEEQQQQQEEHKDKFKVWLAISKSEPEQIENNFKIWLKSLCAFDRIKIWFVGMEQA